MYNFLMQIVIMNSVRYNELSTLLWIFASHRAYMLNKFIHNELKCYWLKQ